MGWRLTLTTLLVLLTACGRLPEVETTTSARAIAAPYPTIINIDPLLEGRQTSIDASAPDPSNLLGRVARLKARAARLRGPILSNSDKSRLRHASQRHQSLR